MSNSYKLQIGIGFLLYIYVTFASTSECEVQKIKDLPQERCNHKEAFLFHMTGLH
jgi:hypothetical protein